MKSDAFIGAVYAGVLAAIVSSVVQLGPILIGVQTISIVVVAAGIFLPIGQIFTPLGIILGIIGHLIIGAIWGIVLYAIFYIFGLDKSVQKGLLLGIFIWFFGTEMMRWNTTNYIIWGDIEQVWKLIHDMIFGTGTESYSASI
ncbi:MAG: hypothetical protein H6Q73_23 [Firmicutes bacterium]|nr:hypothetical protein [Bacillota bacterium]